MDKEKLIEYKNWIKEELERCINFWINNGMDNQHGGIYTCLDRSGKIFSTDKSVWFQGRAAWIFSYLCKIYGIKKEWVNAAKSCLDFMENYCINKNLDNRMYFTVTEDGKPLRQRRYCFSEGFYVIANAEYYGITGDKIYLERAQKTYDLIWKLNNNIIKDPTGLGPKSIPETRSWLSLANPMIYLNITSIMRRCDFNNKDFYNKRALECCNNILKYHFKPELKCTLENVNINGEAELNYSSGRIVNPGHDIECSWFLMEEANYIGNNNIRKKAQQMFDFAFEKGWDKEYGGLLYFIDCKNMPPEAYEHDMKLWWPHNELLIASLMIYRDTNDKKYFKIFEDTLSYCKKVFSDPKYGDWFGYLRRDGQPTLPACKGSTFKGPFHLPRCLIMLDKILDELILS